MIPKDATTTELTRDVAIIGAGPSGLTAAYRLQQAGHTVAVIEARERVGGRTWSNHINGAFLEIGGQWVSPDQTALISLISELGLKTFSRYRDGENLYRDPNGTMHRYTGDMFPANEKTQQEMVRLIEKLDAVSLTPSVFTIGSARSRMTKKPAIILGFLLPEACLPNRLTRSRHCRRC